MTLQLVLEQNRCQSIIQLSFRPFKLVFFTIQDWVWCFHAKGIKSALSLHFLKILGVYCQEITVVNRVYSRKLKNIQGW